MRGSGFLCGSDHNPVRADRLSRALSAAVLCALLAGCYKYAPLDTADAKPGSSVRARLSVPAATRIAPSIVGGNARVLTGVVVDAGPSAFTLEVPSVPAGTPTAQQGLFQRVNIGRGDLVELERRTLDKQRTGAVIAAAIAGAGIIAAAIIHGQSTGSNAPVEPPPNFMRRLTANLRF